MGSAADDLLRGGRTALWSAIGVIAATRVDAHVTDLSDLETAVVTVAVAGLVGWGVNRLESIKSSKFMVPKDRIAGDVALKIQN